jgi:hypothetical protein
MPRDIIIGEYADGTPITTTVLSAREYFDARDPHAPASAVHEPSIEDMPTEALEVRYGELDDWMLGYGPKGDDPRCGCSADNEGGSCYWDSLEQIVDELRRRGVR